MKMDDGIVVGARELADLMSADDRATLICEALKSLDQIYIPEALESALLEMSKDEDKVRGVLEAVIHGFGIGYTKEMLDTIEEEKY